MTDPLILECLEDTSTEWGSSRASEFRRCREAYALAYVDQIVPTWRLAKPKDTDLAGPAYFSVGGLLHSCMQILHRGGNPGALLAYCMQRPGDHDLGHVVEAENLWLWYQAHYDCQVGSAWLSVAQRAGWPDGTEIAAVEQLLEDRKTFVIPETRRLDLVLRRGSQIIVVDHKTRSSRVSDKRRAEYIRGLATKPAVLGQSWLAWQHYKTPDPPAVMYNIFVKTKKPSFDRITVEPTKEQVLRWVGVRQREAREQEALDRGGWRVPNWDACAPEIGTPCHYFKWCHGTKQEQDEGFARRPE